MQQSTYSAIDRAKGWWYLCDVFDKVADGPDRIRGCCLVEEWRCKRRTIIMFFGTLAPSSSSSALCLAHPSGTARYGATSNRVCTLASACPQASAVQLYESLVIDAVAVRAIYTHLHLASGEAAAACSRSNQPSAVAGPLRRM